MSKFEMFLALVVFIGGGLFALGGIAMLAVALYSLIKPGEDPYENEDGDRIGLGVTYP